MLKVSYNVDKILKEWCKRNLGKIIAKDWYNPTSLEELVEDRLNGDVFVYAHGSKNTIFNQEDTKLYYRAWHDTLHIKYNVGFNTDEELLIAEKQYEELIKLGVTPYDAYLVKLDLILHIKHYYKYKVHPEYQGDLVANYIMYGDKALDRNYGY